MAHENEAHILLMEASVATQLNVAYSPYRP